MTREEFESIKFTGNTEVGDSHGFHGRVTMVDFRFGVIHFEDEHKKSIYGFHYSELDLIKEKKHDCMECAYMQERDGSIRCVNGECRMWDKYEPKA